jgi:conjugal transfer/entry exclusion protein
MTRHQNSIPEPIAQLQEQLTQFRNSNQPRTRLPESFWNAAVELARQYGIYQTAHRLRLDYVGLKKRLLDSRGPQQKRTQKPAQPAFVELMASQKTNAEWLIEFESSRGSKMRIQIPAASPLDWTILLRAWREVEG